ncbi:branched-chain amino acid ABC transporter permease [Halomicroarcula limicola]|uniref:Branched-chain amino acid ABC transporter permease n=1 Tax=Haloarcula limicola TaxID=1429915 RepID=A0A8J7Y4F9_9EURY|nr:branched-chain amino acid ABC transporter permease [Halomicroarcula limicola]MBV0924032.1 branched-chain amino acid ABC transporter permease [Halomicroarcula limicola]
MVNGLNLAFQYLQQFSVLVLAAVGLAIIFGIMGVINLAHGEFIMVGAYATVFGYHDLGLPLLASMGLAVVVTAAFGFVVERLLIKRTYGRLFDSMVVTLGLSLVLSQGMLVLRGTSEPSIPTPFGTITYGAFSQSLYKVALALVAVGVLAVVYWLFTQTAYGVRARATIQNEEMSRALGVTTERVYSQTFAIGSALAGLTGALLAPLVSVNPTMGGTYLVKSFVVVVVGGPSVVLGTGLSGGLLGAVDAGVTYFYDQTMGSIVLLVVTVFVIRFFQDGITGFVERARDRLAAEGA